VCSSPPTRCIVKRVFENAAAIGNALLVRVKGNQPSLYDALAALCETRPRIDRHASVDRHRHGRQDHRLTEVFVVDGRLGPGWQPLIACAGRITRLTWLKDTRSGLWTAREDVAYDASQTRLNAATFACTTRRHWASRTRTIISATASSVRTTAASAPAGPLRPSALNILRADDIVNVR
jgi:hypothetical protein